MKNFITKHIIELIEKEIDKKRKLTSITNFFYFNEPILNGNIKINRVSRFNPFVEEDVLPFDWYKLSGSTLIQIYDKIKHNDFFFYKLIDGKSYKAKLKKHV